MIGEKEFRLTKNVKYSFVQDIGNLLVCGENIIPIVVNFKNCCNVFKIQINNDNYYILNPKHIRNAEFFKISHMGKEFYITISQNLSVISTNGSVFNQQIEDISYSHYETQKDLLIIYFTGKRDFVVILQNEKLLCASFYDEFNINDNEKLFMCKLNDCLNHGKVYKVNNGKFEEYLVYLDENNLNLKSRFTCYVFLDCLLAKNFTYCNSLLAEEIKQKESSNIELLFPSFDFYFETKQNEFVLINKNALAGICKFEVVETTIVNIIQLNQD